jgi:ribosome-binding factor A
MLSSCAEPGPEDGIDPRLVRHQDDHGRVPNRKALQLCRQVAETLAGVLAGECNDDLLRIVRVDSVTPAPNSSRLLVTLSPDVTGPDVDAGMIQQRLEQLRGRLRAEVAAAIHRRRCPDLLFRVVSPPG